MSYMFSPATLHWDAYNFTRPTEPMPWSLRTTTNFIILMRDSRHCLPEDTINTVLSMRDDVEAVRNFRKAMVQLPPEQFEKARHKLEPLHRVQEKSMKKAVESKPDMSIGQSIDFCVPQCTWTEAIVETAQLLSPEDLTLSDSVENRHGLRILLIDVEKNRLVEKTIAEKYVALSYVWGNCEVFKTTSNNRRDLLSDDALLQHCLPRVVLDAMLFTKKIKQRFLWVDALCIEQDQQSPEKIAHIQSMDRIYGNAYLTLVAWTAKGADSALPGVSEPSLRPQVIRKELHGIVLENRLSDDIAYLANYEMISHYNTRGWTFQERKLSKR